MAELNEKELEGVSGGAGGDSYRMVPGSRYRCVVTGYYWGDTWPSTPAYNAIIGQVMDVVFNPGAQGQLHFQLVNGNTWMGWTNEQGFRLI